MNFFICLIYAVTGIRFSIDSYVNVLFLKLNIKFKFKTKNACLGPNVLGLTPWAKLLYTSPETLLVFLWLYPFNVFFPPKSLTISPLLAVCYSHGFSTNIIFCSCFFLSLYSINKIVLNENVDQPNAVAWLRVCSGEAFFRYRVGSTPLCSHQE